MRLLIVSPLRMQWEKQYRATFPDAEWSELPKDGYDCYLFMWCDEATRAFINTGEKRGKYVVFVRRYEFYSNLENMDWHKVDAVIMVNDALARGFEQRTSIKPHVIYNGVNPADWKYQERGRGHRIAWVGFLNQKKNLPLALQIMAALPSEYELHIAGEVQDLQVYDYLDNFARSARVKVIYHGHIPHERMDWWLDDKHYILSTAISEGCPNHVIEAMAKGIKPIVHNWPGAEEQFPGWTFNTVDEAVKLIGEPYESKTYRNTAEEEFGLHQYEIVKGVVESVC